jgi:Holliday junction resolvase RusA-like endonuclease
MELQHLELTVLGIPGHKQSARFFNRGGFMKSYQPTKVVNWVAQARAQIVQQLGEDWKPIPYRIRITELKFVHPILKSFTKKFVAQLKEGMIGYKSTKPDLDNSIKQTFDACNGLVWVDDAIIVEYLKVSKVFEEVPKTIIKLEWGF